MKYNQHAHYVRTSLSIVLVVCIANLIASHVSLATRADTETAPLNPFDGPTDFIRRIPLTTNDLVYSAATGKLYASIPSAAGSSGNSIAAIDPTTGITTSSTFIGSEPNRLTLSDDGHSLYVSLNGAAAVRRFDVLTNTPGLQFSLGQDSFSGRFSVTDFAVAPGNPDLLAVTRSSGAGVAVFDNGVRRTKVGPIQSSDFLAFSASASKFYVTGQSNGLQTMSVDASGVTVSATSSLAAGTRIKFSDGKIFSSLGHVINPDSNTLLGTFPVGNSFFTFNSTGFVPDAVAGRAYYLAPGQTNATIVLKAFDLNTFLPVGSLTISGVEGSPTSLVRWGANGLAFRTSDNQLFIIQTSLIPSAEPIPTPTPAPSPAPSPSPSPSPAAAFVRQIALSTNDLVYDQAMQKIYASVPSNAGSTGNSIAEIDPVTGSIASQVFVGSEPTVLAQADDGQTLYVGLEGAASIRKYNINSHTAGAQFPVGRDSFTGPYWFTDIAVSPGNPSVVAVARQQHFNSPSERGVAVFDDGVQRTKTGPEHLEGSDFLAFGSSSTLYGNGPHGLSTMTVDSTGVTVTGTTTLPLGTSISFNNNLIYSSTGQVLNPSTGDLVGSFSGGLMFDATHVVDSANGRIFFLVGDGGFADLQLRAFDINTFLPLGFVNFPGVKGSPRSLVRWGSNGLAFRTGNRQLFLVETELVNQSVPVASPTPTPSPTPSPSPAYIPTFVRQLNLPANYVVYSEATQALYASVPSSAGTNGNSITKIDPATGAMGPSTFIGSEPNRIAVSNDGQTLWVHLDGANAARRFDVVTETPGLQFTTNAQPPFDMEVVPGSPQSLAISKAFGNGLAIYDDGVQRSKTSSGVGPIEFGGDPSILYGFNNFSSGLNLVKFLVDPSGLTTSTSIGGFFTVGNALKFSDGLLYSGGGRVGDPENGTLVGTFQDTGFAPVMCVDSANHRVFYAFENGSNVDVRAFDANTFLHIGSVSLPGINGTPINLVRWGTNGLAFNTLPFGLGTSQVYVIQTELVSSAGTVPTGLQFETNTTFPAEGSTVQVKVLRTGDVTGAVSVNYGTADGTATAGSDYTATSGTLNFEPGELTKIISIPIVNDNIYEGATETFTLTLSGPTGSAILTAPGTMTIKIADNQFKPFVSIASNVRISEGDSGTKNAAVNLTLPNASFETITVDYATANGSATAGDDYVANSGKVTFAPGTTSATINVVLNGDSTVEPDETFSVNLSNATNASFIANANSSVTIANDDATVQLSNAALNVNEGAGFAAVTVTRLGDGSRTATVHYSTNDTAGLENCTLANGKASERCDYGTTVGSVQFAIGETVKTIIIPIVDDALVEGNEIFTVNLKDPAGANSGATNAATITVVDNDTTPATQNPIDGVNFFVTQQYIDFLGRLPDSIGFANWTDTLSNCPNGGFGENINPGCDRVHVSAGFFLSEEFRGRGYFAYKFYEVGFDRRPTYAEFVPDMAEVGGAQSPESEVLSKAAYTDAFVQRQEFKNHYDALSNSDFVNAVETNAEVTLPNKAALIDALNSSQKTRAQVLREIVELQAVTDKFFIRAFVAMQYFGYLRRDPDTTGYANWVSTLEADPNNFRHMIFGFIFSDEYRHRFGP